MTDTDYKAAGNMADTLIRRVLAGELSFEECDELWPDYSGDQRESLEAAYHALCHFDIDHDTRAKDACYADSQIEELKDIARRLHGGEPLSASQLAWLTPRWSFSPPE